MLTIYITGTVSLDGEFYMAPNVSINILNGGWLHTKATYTTGDGPRSAKLHMLSCYDMWDGIVVQNFGRVELEQYDLIEDAKVAIASNGSTITSTNPLLYPIVLTDVAFNKNNIGVSIKNYTETLNNVSPFEISGCVFTCRNFTYTSYQNFNFPSFVPSWPEAVTLKAQSNFTNNMAPPSDLMGFTPAVCKAPFSNAASMAGVWVENSGLTFNPTNSIPLYYSIIIGDRVFTDAVNANLFDNLSNGIYCLNSNVCSYNNYFQNSRPFFVPPYLFFGAGIRAINNNMNPLNYNNYLNLTAATNPTLNNNLFYECDRGVEINNIFQVDLQYAQFRSNQSKLVNSNVGNEGVFIINNRFKNYKINNNLFLNLKRGVSMIAVQGGYNVTGTFGYGQVWGSVNIKNNYFSPVANPSITIGNNFMQDAVIIQNLLNSNGADVGPGTGFYTITPNNGIWIQNNTIDQTYRGIFMLNFSNSLFGKFAANNHIRLRQDHITSNPQWGVNTTNNYFSVVNTNTIIGFSTNTIMAMSGITSAYNINSTSRCNNTDNLPFGFEFNGNNPSTIWRDNIMNNQSIGMISRNNGIIGQQGTSSTPSDNYWQGGTWIGSNFNVFSSNSDPSFSKIYNRTLAGYNPLNGHGAPIPYGPSTLLSSNNSAPYFGCTPIVKQNGGNNPTKASFYSAMINGAIPYVINSIETDEINKFIIYNDLDNDTIFRTDTISLSNFYSNNQSLDIGILSQIEKAFAEGDTITANSILNSYSPITSIQTNYKEFFDLYSSYKSNGSLNLTEMGDLETLANKCPHIDGLIVYSARVLFDLINNVFAPYDDNYCYELSNSYYEEGGGNEEGRIRSINNDYHSNEMKREYAFFPNPAVDEIKIIGSRETEDLFLVIKDLTDKIIINTQIQLQNHTANLKLNLKNGMYFVTLIRDKQNVFAKKIVISK